MTIQAMPGASSPLPARTRLYHLAPLGVTTARVESLTGYVMRLAEAHCVSTGALVAEELLPLMRPEGLHGMPPATWLGRMGAHMNGTGAVARAAVAALGTLTGRRELVLLTLLPWSSAVADHGLLRCRQRTRAWCSACLVEALEQHNILYEPLSWALADVTACAQHQTPLSERCPYPDCGRRLPVLAAFGRPGHCSWCRRVLALQGQGRAAPSLNGAATPWSCWVAEQIGAWLAATPPSPEAPSSIAAAIERLTAARGTDGTGTHQAFARTVGIHANLVQRWRSDRACPTMLMLLRMAHALDISLLQLVTGDTRAPARIHAQRATTIRAPEKSPRRPPAVLDPARVRQEVTALALLDEWPPPSGAEVARRLNCSAAALSRADPESWRALVTRHREYRSEQRTRHERELASDVRRAVDSLVAQGLFPSTRRIRPLLPRPMHPRRAQFYAIRRRILQELGWFTNTTSRSQG